MSFFRSVTDLSSSKDASTSQEESEVTSDEEDYSISRVRTIGSAAPSRSSNVNDATDAFSPSSAPASFHRDGVIHALLEERCMYEAMNELRNNGISAESLQDPQVRSLGSQKYRALTQNLSAAGVVRRGLDTQHYSDLRQQYRNGLDLISRNPGLARPQLQKAVSHITLALPEPLRKFVTGNEDTEYTESLGRQMSLANIGDDRPRVKSLPTHPLLDDTKYAREFDEYNVLGKGGYGVVFHAKHKLDGSPYAIKKIPLGDNRIRRIQQKGQSEMDNILLELRTLAKLNHPNVVRYHTGWIEYASFSTKRQLNKGNVQKFLEAPETESMQETSITPSIDIQFQFDDDDDIPNQTSSIEDDRGIVFEDSSIHTEDSKIHIRGFTNDPDPHSGSLSAQTSSFSGNELHKTRSRSTFASIDDEEVEHIERNDPSISESGLDTSCSALGNSSASPEKPCLALYIQMSLYSMTLADFLSPSLGDFDSSAVASLRHCFHADATLHMLSSIIDGVRYLHKEDIVHRDLKPGNIFLAIRPGSDSPPGAIDLSGCSSCAEMAEMRPFNVDVCIGDFGLVSKIAKAEDTAPVTSNRVVGTEIYRPGSVTRDNHPCLDVYALGMIAFEMFWKFETRMERYETLHKLKRGEFPEGFDEEMHCPGLQKWIGGMITATENQCPSWQSLKSDATVLRRHCMEGKTKE